MPRHSHGRDRFERGEAANEGGFQEKMREPFTVWNQGRKPRKAQGQEGLIGRGGRENGERGNILQNVRYSQRKRGRGGKYERRGNERQQPILKKNTFDHETFAPNFNDIDKQHMAHGEEVLYQHGFGDNSQRQEKELVDSHPDSLTPHELTHGTSQDYYEGQKNSSPRESGKKQSWEFTSGSNIDTFEDGFGDKIGKRNQAETRFSQSGHAAYIDEFSPSPEQGVGGFDPLFRPSSPDPTPAVASSYQGRLQQEGFVEGLYPSLPSGVLPPVRQPSRGNSIDWGSWGPDQGIDIIDQLDDPSYETRDTAYNAQDIQLNDPGEDFGNEIYYEKDDGSKQGSLQDDSLVPHFDFDEFHRSADSWY